jgi:toxin ParE1/3/4
MTRAIHWHATAKRDLYAHAEYLSERSLVVAERFIVAVHDACELLASSPEIGGLVRTGIMAHQGARVWSIREFRNYLLLYRVDESGIEIVGLLHGAQGWTESPP